MCLWVCGLATHVWDSHMFDVVSAGFSVVSVTLASWLGHLGSLRYVGSSFYMVSCPTVTFFTWYQEGPGYPQVIYCGTTNHAKTCWNKQPPFHLLIILCTIILGWAQLDGSSAHFWYPSWGITGARWFLMVVDRRRHDLSLPRVPYTKDLNVHRFSLSCLLFSACLLHCFR